MTSSNNIEIAAQKISSSKRILIFSGAGISTSSGIPDFRGNNGLWRKKNPVYFDEFISDETKRKEYWEYKIEFWNYIKKAKPTFSHFFITKLFRMGKIIGVVTQNIDGLHQKAGIPQELIVELHGNNRFAVCIECGKKIEFDEAISIFISQRNSPRCSCGGLLKPDVVMFGEPLDIVLLHKAFYMAQNCDLVLSIGSTLLVQPASNIPLRAKLNGSFYIVVSKGNTAHDNICDIKIDDDCDYVFREIDLRISKSLTL